MKKLLLLVGLVALVSGCGYDYKEWHKEHKTDSWHTDLGTPSEIDTYYNSMATYELCIEWDRVLRDHSSSQVDIRRKEIAQALQRKGEDPLLCSNPSADQTYTTEKKTKAALSKAKKAQQDAERATRKAEEDAERAKREAELALRACRKAAEQAYQNCMKAKPIFSQGGYTCNRTSC